MLCALSSAYAYDFEVGGLGYAITSHVDLTCEVRELVDTCLEEVVIPEKVIFRNKEIKVCSIGDGTFRNSSIRTIKIPSSINSMSSSVFENCRNLITVDFQANSSLSMIPYRAFAGCTSLTNVNLPMGVSEIGSYAFEGCENLSFINLSNLSSIGEKAFYKCSALENISLSENRCYIGMYAFCATGLKNINIPSGCKLTLCMGAFRNCRALEEINLPTRTKFEWGVGSDGFTFSNCVNLKKVILSDGITDLPECIFSGCSNLKYVSLPDSLQSIQAGAFGSTAIDNISIPLTVRYLGEGAFSDCKNLHEISLPGTIRMSLYCEAYKSYNYGKKEYYDTSFTLRDCPIEKLRILSGDSITFSYYDLDKNYTRLLAYPQKYLPNTIKHLYIDMPKFVGGSSNYTTYADGSRSPWYHEYESISLSFPTLNVLEIGPHMQNISCLKWNFPELQQLISRASTPPKLPSMSNKEYLNLEVIVPTEYLEVYKNAPVWQNFWNLRGDDTSGIKDVNISPSSRHITAKIGINGFPVDESYRGIVIIRYSDGTTKKVVQ